MAEFKLYPDQQEIVDKAMDYINSKRVDPTVIVAPTSQGKSLIISELARSMKGTVLVLQPKIELLKQNYDKYLKLGGTEAKLFSASVNSREVGKVTYATLGSIKKYPELFQDVELILIDECHMNIPPGPDSMFMKFVSQLPCKKFIGLTATPFYMKSTQQGSTLNFLTRMKPRFFKDVLHVTQVSTMIENGRWSPVKYQVFPFKETGLKQNSTFSDFTKESVAKAIRDQNIPKAILERTKECLSKGASSILIFADSVDSAKIITEGLKDDAVMVSDKTKAKDREQYVEDFKSGKKKVMVNYGIYSTGFDYPELQIVMMGRPTKSLALYYQIYGRLTRKPEQPKVGLFIDFGGNVKRLGKIESLEIIDYPNWGWGCFMNDVVKTNVPMGLLPKTKAMIDAGPTKDPNQLFSFGKYKGKPAEEVPISYMKFMLGLEDFKWIGRDRVKLKEKLIELTS